MKTAFAFFEDQKGTTAIQYALIAGVLSVAVLAASLTLRDDVIDLYQGIGEETNAALVTTSED